MTFRLHKITITNFRSYVGTHLFEFPQKSGLYYFTGQNLIDDLGANGAGKTTFMDAITWCLYGVTTRGLKATDVLSDWEMSGCVVELDLTVGDQRSTVKRTQKPNNLELDGTPVDQEELEKYLRLNHTAFLHSVLSAQFGTSFFSLTSSIKLTLFSKIMNLDFWLTLSKAAGEEAKAIEAEIIKLKSKMDRAKGQIHGIKEELPQLDEQEASFEDDRQARLEDIKAKSADVYKERMRAGKEIDKLEDKQAGFREIVKLARRKVKLAEQNRDEIFELAQDCKRNRDLWNTKLAEHNEKRRELEALSGSKCVTCGAPIDQRHVALAKNQLLEDNKAILSKITNIEASRKKHLDNLALKRLDVDRLEGELAEAEAALSELHDRLVHQTRIYDAMGNKIDVVAEQIDALQKEQNPYVALKAQKKKTLAKLKADLAVDKESLHVLEAEHSAYSYWVKGFKRVRLYVIEQAFQALEIEVNNSLTQLGMQGWQITFDIERENKSGNVTKGFMVFVKGPRNKRPVKWENWSGGESQRLELAGDLGLSNLIMQQVGLRSTIEFYDEPSTHLSDVGLLDLADMLHERAISEDKVIWIVDHTAVANYGEFEGIIRVVKNEHGSKITQG